MLEIRRITAAEEVEASKIGVVAFCGRHDFTQVEAPDPLRDPDDWTWGAFENGKMVSRIVEIPYVMRFDGCDAKMSGIGGVATLPESRRGSRIRKIFEALLRDAYANGVVFSCLAPFSYAFYRQFGYELCVTRREITISASDLSVYRAEGSHEMILPGGDTEGLKKVHEKYIADMNHAVRRDVWPDDAAWRDFTRRDPYKTGSYIYLWRDGAGEPRGYIKFQNKNQGQYVNDIEVSELLFTDRDSLYAQLAFAGGLSAAIRDFVWSAPAFIDPSAFAEAAGNIKQRLVPRDMTRVVNVGAALGMARRPEGEGAYVVGVEDPIIPENSGNWLVEYGPSGSAVSLTSREADVICDLPVFAQLVTGYRPIDDILLTSNQNIDIRGNLQTLRKVFTQRRQHLTEYF